MEAGLFVSRNEWLCHNSEMESPGGRRISPFRVMKQSTKLPRLSKTTRSRSARSNDWAECRDKKSVGTEPTGEECLWCPVFSLTRELANWRVPAADDFLEWNRTDHYEVLYTAESR
jgi:hypothetical protein